MLWRIKPAGGCPHPAAGGTGRFHCAGSWTSTGAKQDVRSTDTGLGISYQFFIGRYFYIQPGAHLYLQGNNSSDFNGTTYKIHNADFSPVARVGFRLWRKC